MNTPNCVELVNELHSYKVANPQHDKDLVTRARAELAKPEGPTPPSRREIKAWMEENADLWVYGTPGVDDFVEAIEAALARWGRP